MRQLRVGPQQRGEGFDEADLIFAGLQIADGEDEGRGEAEAGSYGGLSFFTPDDAKLRIGGVRDDVDLVR